MLDKETVSTLLSMGAVCASVPTLLENVGSSRDGACIPSFLQIFRHKFGGKGRMRKISRGFKFLTQTLRK